MKYTVEHSKQYFQRNGKTEHVKQGSVVELTADQAKRLGNKVKLVETGKRKAK